MTLQQDFESFVESIRNSECDFYRNLWRSAPSSELPLVRQKDFVRVPLSHRRYKDAKSIVKIIAGTDGMFLSEWDIEDIKSEPFGVRSRRPMAYFENSYETNEKAWWCYMNGMMRCAGEANVDIAIAMATKFQIDSLIADTASARVMLPHLSAREPLDSVSIIDTSFDASFLASLAPHAKSLRLVLALPETGAFAESPYGERPSFSPLPGCRVETVDGSLVVSKLTRLVTPIIRYDTGMRAADVALRGAAIH